MRLLFTLDFYLLVPLGTAKKDKTIHHVDDKHVNNTAVNTAHNPIPCNASRVNIYLCGTCNGYSDWHLGYPDCGKESQSPIDLAADVETVVNVSYTCSAGNPPLRACFVLFETNWSFYQYFTLSKHFSHINKGVVKHFTLTKRFSHINKGVVRRGFSRPFRGVAASWLYKKSAEDCQ